MSNPILTAKGVSKIFTEGRLQVDVLRQVDFSIHAGEMVAIVGRSGAGKSTLLHILGGLEKPSVGQVYWGEQDVARLSEAKKSRLRNDYLGFVYQFHHLLPEFTAWENVAMPMMLGKVSAKQAKATAINWLKEVGLFERKDHKVAELSGGERQRVAIARALTNNPKCVLADEPTGNLDQETSQHVFDLMLNLQQQHGISFVMVTHDLNLANTMAKVYQLTVDGLA